MERVVYLLGAGFSAPLGLPLAGNFLEKAKDMCSHDGKRRKHFSSTFEDIKGISESMAYYSTNVFDIEEVLSILEMRQRLSGKEPKLPFSDFISEVIEYYTPALKPYSKQLTDENWRNIIFGGKQQNRHWLDLCYFVSNIHNLIFSKVRDQENVLSGTRCTRNPGPQMRYSIITLNYDHVLEKVCEFINEDHEIDDQLSFATTIEQKEADPEKPVLAKLHGTAGGTIIPPTYSKDTASPEILEAWKLAYKALTEANYLRIIGYSLPATDNYIRYLLKAAITDTFHLKQIDILCMDPDRSVKEKYSEFIEFPHCEFLDVDVEKYLTKAQERTLLLSKKKSENDIYMDYLEEAHQRFVEEQMNLQEYDATLISTPSRVVTA